MIQIVFENQNFVICDKLSGVLSTPSRHEKEDSRLCLGTALQDKLKVQIFPVHRLDFEVSGLVLYAKSSEAHRVANAWFEKQEVEKTYQAFTVTQDYSHIPVAIENPRENFKLTPGQVFRWEGRIFRGKKRSFTSPQGKASLTEACYKDEISAGILHWELKPVTGRSHQLRFDLSRHGFPILGDKLYGSKDLWQGNVQSIALRSFRLDFSNAPGALELGLAEIFEVSGLERIGLSKTQT